VGGPGLGHWAGFENVEELWGDERRALSAGAPWVWRIPSQTATNRGWISPQSPMDGSIIQRVWTGDDLVGE